MRLTLEKYTPLAFLMGLALLISLSVVSYQSLNELSRTADQVIHAHRMIAQLEETLSDFKDIVIGYRGYVLTGKESYLDVYHQGRQDMDFNFRELRNMTADDPQQRQRLNELEQLKQRNFNRSEEIIRMRRTRGFNDALALLERDTGQKPLDEIRRVIKEMEAEADRLLWLREAAARSSARRATTVLATGSSMGVLLTALAIMAVGRELERRKRADALLRQVNVELERRVAERTSELSAATRRLQFAPAERERLFANEQAARQTAEEANRMKDEFLAVLSHELRSPLNAIVGYANLIRGGGHKPGETPRMLEIILRNARAQRQLIEDMLDVSRIVTGKMGLNLRLFEPEMVIRRALDTVRPAAEAKQITLDATFGPSGGVISGDADRLQQAVWNLLSNAVKFTSEGGKVTVRLRRVDSQAEIAVSDTGKGINPEYLPHVFDRFSQEDYSTTRRYGGLGLGLSIVRHITEMHGGTVYAASEGEGRGATFSIRLPLRVGQMAQSQTRTVQETDGFTSRETESELDGARVLVVDDDADTRQLLKQILENHGAVVRTADSAAEALKMITTAPPDALVADIGMPDEDGYTLMRKIRKLPSDRGGEVTAIALTAYARPDDRARAMTAGFQHYVTKPVEPHELAAVVASLTERLDDPSPNQY